MRMDGAELTMSGRAATNPAISGGKGERVSFRAVSTERRFDEASGDWVDGDEFGVTVVCWRQLGSSVLQLIRKRRSGGGDGEDQHPQVRTRRRRRLLHRSQGRSHRLRRGQVGRPDQTGRWIARWRDRQRCRHRSPLGCSGRHDDARSPTTAQPIPSRGVPTRGLDASWWRSSEPSGRPGSGRTARPVRRVRQTVRWSRAAGWTIPTRRHRAGRACRPRSALRPHP